MSTPDQDLAIQEMIVLGELYGSGTMRIYGIRTGLSARKLQDVIPDLGAVIDELLRKGQISYSVSLKPGGLAVMIEDSGRARITQFIAGRAVSIRDNISMLADFEPELRPRLIEESVSILSQMYYILPTAALRLADELDLNTPFQQQHGDYAEFLKSVQGYIDHRVLVNSKFPARANTPPLSQLRSMGVFNLNMRRGRKTYVSGPVWRFKPPAIRFVPATSSRSGCDPFRAAATFVAAHWSLVRAMSGPGAASGD